MEAPPRSCPSAATTAGRQGGEEHPEFTLLHPRIAGSSFYCQTHRKSKGTPDTGQRPLCCLEERTGEGKEWIWEANRKYPAQACVRSLRDLYWPTYLYTSYIFEVIFKISFIFKIAAYCILISNSSQTSCMSSFRTALILTFFYIAFKKSHKMNV